VDAHPDERALPAEPDTRDLAPLRDHRGPAVGQHAESARVERPPLDQPSAIDAEAGENRTQFMLAAAREAVARARRARLDAEIGSILAEDAEENLAMLGEFAHTMADGLDGNA